ncbi:MAG: alpha-galactosidase [Phycisphaerae bacterium]|nr:alpha-galactosidase [Phycisphaerae bacterium]NIP53420.1 alpha-galactosidase [Phycisphaerae bacterium]NIS52670.1 alpha-galactosidase [Phycisphaerae bacterium]NIU09912.1 alpha-galactosidase [Phycisphaerae bacterium]NIU57650.1 alpha-galactosidase [Phycisphaerae bacterium]
MNTFRLINVNPKTVGVYILTVVVALMSLAVPLWSDEPDEQETVWLSSLDLSKMTVGWGKPQVNKSIVGKPLSIAGRKFDKGVGSHAGSMMYIDLQAGSKKFSAFVGVDDEVKGKPASVEFRVYADGKSLWSSGVMKAGEPAKKVSVDLEGIKTLLLLVDSTSDGVGYDHADWAEAKFEVTGPKPKAMDPPVIKEEKIILTPKPGPEPRINGPTVYGCRPGRPFIYRIPCTGERPIVFTAKRLPRGLKLDKATGIITGTTPKKPRRYKVILTASNSHGKAKRDFNIVVGDTLALTPPMGWNHWYTWYNRITDRHLREAADVMIESGMADYGYQYVNIDDCWMIKPGSKDPELKGPNRHPDGTINTNARFPDMKVMTEYIHSKGLKAGLYTSPGPLTCAGFVGTYQHEQQDAETFAEWGFDFLKYDWCSYGRIAKDRSLPELQKPYIKMGNILKNLDRDIVLNLCQYGMGEVWKWGGKVGGNCWRTTGDLGLARGTNLPGFYRIGLSNARHWEYAKPGQWNDPDYILIGYVGNARKKDHPPIPTKLTPNEQYSYMSMWCLMAAPLFYSGDMARLDEFTLNILCNAEVIEVDQDPLGRQAKPIVRTEQVFILAKPMEDGSLAVGLFNLDEVAGPISVSFSQLEIEGPRRVRDLWRHKDIGVFKEKFETEVPRHGVALLRFFPAR